MSENGRDERLSRLQQLADRLERAQAAAGDLVSKRVAPVDEVIRRIGVSGPDYWHRGEWLAYCAQTHSTLEETLEGLPDDVPTEHPFAFARETAADGAEVEYALCAARGRDRKCGLYVSVCTWRELGAVGERGAAVESRELLRPDELPQQFPVGLLDVLDEFVDAYECYVRRDRRTLLESAACAEAEVRHPAPPEPPFARPVPGAGAETAAHPWPGEWTAADTEEIKRRVRESMPDMGELKRQIRESMPDPEELKRQIRDGLQEIRGLFVDIKGRGAGRHRGAGEAQPDIDRDRPEPEEQSSSP